ncbi:MAG: AAA family ATPase, partial [Ignavibacteria bacterium]
MILDKLYLASFRNYKNCSLNFNPKFNFIWGDNGNGKTNILEAISLICYTKSFLQSSEQDCVSRGSFAFQITGEFLNGNGMKSKVLFNYNKDIPDKQIYCNGEPIGR